MEPPSSTLLTFLCKNEFHSPAITLSPMHATKPREGSEEPVLLPSCFLGAVDWKTIQAIACITQVLNFLFLSSEPNVCAEQSSGKSGGQVIPENQGDWFQFLPLVVYAKNSLRYSSTQITPFQCVLGVPASPVPLKH